MSEEKPVGSEFPPNVSNEEKPMGAEHPPKIDTSVINNTIPSTPPPPYPPGPSGQFSPQTFTPTTTTTGYHTVQTPQSIYQTHQNFIPLQDRSLPPPPQSPQSPQSPPLSGYVSPQQPQHPQQPGVVYVTQPQMQPQQVHVVNMPAQTTGIQQIISHFPVNVVCPYCHNNIITVVTETVGGTAYLWSFILFLVCCPLMWLPCVISSCMDKTHTCPRCNNVLAIVKA
ncbi:LITAF-like zinc ribbon domain-containing protein [Glomus cerebriforme]|uniref:LITAF-like zinc ribbon domain-containing protein n=1 Tax=Glomus cerebriforme TaxID=658196 RepID=A0A397SSH0_9GLOM|nr:LITAF-like zinc ribbon domain-containing protein [Glomus cerebriforme]